MGSWWIQQRGALRSGSGRHSRVGAGVGWGGVGCGVVERVAWGGVARRAVAWGVVAWRGGGRVVRVAQVLWRRVG